LYSWREGIEDVTDVLTCIFSASCRNFSEHCFKFGKHLFDGVRNGAVGRQKDQPGAAIANSIAHRLTLVTAEIVEQDDIAGAQRRDQTLLDSSQKASAIDRPIKDAGRADAVGA
jgi:hypothetical protein